MDMEEIKEALTQLSAFQCALTAPSAIRYDISKVSDREWDFEARNPPNIQHQPLARARTEYELKEISTFPDCVKELQTFDGKPGEYVSWINRAQSLLSDYEVFRGRPPS